MSVGEGAWRQVLRPEGHVVQLMVSFTANALGGSEGWTELKRAAESEDNVIISCPFIRSGSRVFGCTVQTCTVRLYTCVCTWA